MDVPGFCTFLAASPLCIPAPVAPPSSPSQRISSYTRSQLGSSPLDFVSVSCLRERRCALFGIARLARCARATCGRGSQRLHHLQKDALVELAEFPLCHHPARLSTKRSQLSKSAKRCVDVSSTLPRLPALSASSPEETCPFFDFTLLQRDRGPSAGSY